MRIATFNVNGVNGRLPRLLEWLEETQPDVACLQELKAPQDRFPEAAIEKAGYGAIWAGGSPPGGKFRTITLPLSGYSLTSG